MRAVAEARSYIWPVVGFLASTGVAIFMFGFVGRG
jgi:hypothetical protein